MDIGDFAHLGHRGEVAGGGDLGCHAKHAGAERFNFGILNGDLGTMLVERRMNDTCLVREFVDACWRILAR